MDERLQRLIDRDEIRGVLHAYCRGIDRLDLEAVRRCYHSDATDEHGSFSGSVDAYIEWVGKLLPRYEFTMHLITNVQIDFPDAPAGVDGAVRKAAVESYGIALHRGRDEMPYLNLATGFRYLDRFEERRGTSAEDQAAAPSGDWRIAARVVVSEWSLQIPQSAWWAIPDSMQKGRRDSGDAIFKLLASIGHDGKQSPPE